MKFRDVAIGFIEIVFINYRLNRPTFNIYIFNKLFRVVFRK